MLTLMGEYVDKGDDHFYHHKQHQYNQYHHRHSTIKLIITIVKVKIMPETAQLLPLTAQSHCQF